MENVTSDRLFDLTVTVFFCFLQVGTVNPVWSEVTLSLQEALLHLPFPREERRKGSAVKSTLQNLYNTQGT